MAVTIEQIEQELDAGGLKYMPAQPPLDGVILGMTTTNFRNSQGDNSLPLWVHLDQDFIKVHALTGFKLGGTHYWEFLQACLWIQTRTKLIQFEFDEHGAMMHIVVEWYVGDGTVTAVQLVLTVSALVKVAEEFSPALQAVLETGVITPSSSRSDAAPSSLGRGHRRRGHEGRAPMRTATDRDPSLAGPAPQPVSES